MLAPYISSGKLILLTDHKIKSADIEGDRVRSLEAVSLRTGNKIILSAPWFADASECGDLLPLTGTEYITGTESKSETNELHAPEKPIRRTTRLLQSALQWIISQVLIM
jgi:hypothetical protein